jgi:formylglycine-generating enzyme
MPTGGGPIGGTGAAGETSMGSGGMGSGGSGGGGTSSGSSGETTSGTSGGGGVSTTGSAGAGQNAAGAGSTAGTPTTGPPSCNGMTGSECQGDDCCASPLIPGGTFERTTPLTFTATVSSFRLDKFEVTVARYRNFLSVRDEWRAAGNPVAGAGEHPHIPGTGWDEEWEGDWGIDPDGTYCHPDSSSSGTYAAVGRDTLPVNCVSWIQAFEFCLWDGGRLPTETEWEYAAVGGPLQYQYPWGNAPVPSGFQDESAEYLVYDNLGDGSAATDVSFADILPVGSRPLGAGPFGQMDLAGSVFEWTLDTIPMPTPEAMAPVTDWVYFVEGVVSAIRGGNWASPPGDINITDQAGTTRGAHESPYGFRCARSP